jgi:hypothetical protein
MRTKTVIIRIVMDWLGLWCATPFVVQCDVPIQVAVAKLNAAKKAQRYRYGAVRGRGSNVHAIGGKVSADGVRLVARPRIRNAWTPVFYGRLTPAPQGCCLDGSFATRPATLVFHGLSLTVVATGIVMVLVAVVRSMIVDTWSATLSALLALFVVIGFAAIVIATIGFAGRSGRKDRQFLEAWIVTVLGGR